MAKNLLLITSLAGALLGAGCSTYAEDCAGYGFEPETPAFSQCMMQLDLYTQSAWMAVAMSYQAQAYQSYQPTCYTQPWGTGYTTTCR